MKLTDEQRKRRNALAERRMAEQTAVARAHAKAPAQIIVDPTRSHFFGDIPNGCWCGTYHYICDDCGADCTAGTSAGPCTSRDQLADGRRRCAKCDREYETRIAAASPGTEEERDAIEEAILSALNGNAPSLDVREIWQRLRDRIARSKS